MQYDLASRYKILFEINNAVVNQTSKKELFNILSIELKKHFSYDRMSIILFNEEQQSLKYFATDGIKPSGISSLERPLTKGQIAKMVIQSKQPVIIDDLTRYKDLSSVGHMVEAGLRSILAFPLIIRNRILGTLHFSFRKPPNNISELSEMLNEVTKQVAIAVDNMLGYTELDKLNKKLEQENRFLIQNIEKNEQDEFYYESPAMTEIMNLVKRLAGSDASILITGETGTGKGYIAQTIHNLSLRRDHLFIKINCPALATSLFESELFGHARGAFTGADSKRTGRFELAHGGTIFLDEVAELPIALQAKLLNVLQDRKLERVGDNQPVPIDCRIIAATNKNPIESINDGTFRQDLFFRLNTVSIHVPPLRERREDIPLLIRKINQIQSHRLNRPEHSYSARALELLCSYHWPGNVRELENLVKRMVILKPGEKISVEDIEKLTESTLEKSQTNDKKLLSLEEIERLHIIRVIKKAKGIISGPKGAARLLGLNRSTLQYRMKKLGIRLNNL